MEIDAFPMRLVALTDGVLGGREHVVLFLRPAGEGPPRGFALPLDDARLLRAGLGVVLREAEQIEARIADAN
ncbi:MAG TPA: hypothetical protein VFE78_32840 [Gemmataceae bacterium]|jgi:hypothetical protein|nr:hypothetical protein [Gemmataceae bacterium]